MPPRKRLGQLLTELGVVDEHQLQSALGHQKQWGGKLGAVLVQKGFCKEAEVVTALSKHLGMPSVRLAEAKIDARAVKFVSKQIAEKLHVFPYEISGTGRGEVVTIAMSDPTDLSAVDQLAFHTGKRIKPMLAGDSEIVLAIQSHYADDKAAKPVAAAASGQAPAAASGPQRAVAAATAAPASASTSSSGSGEFPRRIGPPAATPSAGTPYIPPPIPILAPKPEEKLEEIEPDESMSVPAPPPITPQPLDLPEDDGEMMGLEPIAAHSQFGDEVSGHEEVEGAGSAGDAVEGLQSAGVPHEGAGEAAQMDGLEPISAHAAAPEGGWGGESTPAEAWSAEPAAAASVGAGTDAWGEPAPAPPADAPAPDDSGAAQDWTSSHDSSEGWGAEQTAPAARTESAWGATPAWSAGGESPEEAAAPAQSETPRSDSLGEELPMDAIIGTAEAAEGVAEAPAWGEEPAVGAAPAEEQSASEEGHAQAAEAEPPQDEHAAGAEPPKDEHAALEEPPQEEHAAPEQPAPEQSAAPEESPQEEAHPGHAPLEESFHHEHAEAPDAWASSEDPLAAGSAPSPDAEQAWSDAPPAEPLPSAEVAPSTDKFALSAAAETAAESVAAEPETPAEPEMPAEAETPAEPAWSEAASDDAPAPVPQEAEAEEPPSEDVSFDEPPSEEPSTEAGEFGPQGEELKLEGWVAPPPEPEPQGAGWFGQALEATTPLSAADLGTLASIGIDPNDGVAALRLLAALVRVLHRRQLLELDEVAAEVHESRAQATAERAAAEAEANNGAPPTPADVAEGQPPPEGPAET